jgi:hypothetical protein
MIAEAAIEAPPYRELLAPAYCDDVFKPIPPRTPAARRFAQAETLHEVLRLALEDFEAVSRDARYEINLNSWHAPAAHRLKSAQDNHCEVCLAGSVIARSLGAPIEYWLNPDDYTEDIEQRLMALDNLRSGNVLGAVNRLHGASPATAHVAAALTGKYKIALRQFAVEPLITHERAGRFLACMRALQVDLEEAGL